MSSPYYPAIRIEVAVSLETLQVLFTGMHVAAGGFGLAIAAPVLFAAKRRGLHTRLGRVFGVTAATVSITSLALVAWDPKQLWPFVILALFTVTTAGAGIWLARAKPRLPRSTWYVLHLNLMSSAVIGFVTAFLVQMLDGSLVAWLGPTLVGSPLIAIRSAKARREPRGLRTIRREVSA